MARYDSIPLEFRNIIDNLPIDDNLKNTSLPEVWRLMVQVERENSTVQARPQFKTFLNRFTPATQRQEVSEMISAEIARLEDTYMIGGRRRNKSRKNKKSSKRRRNFRKNKKSMKRRR
jgi:hypothetical protein